MIYLLIKQFLYKLTLIKYNMTKVGIVGASGLVGQEILRSIEILNLKDYISKLCLYGSSDSVGKTMSCCDNIYELLPFDNTELNYLNYCILAVDNKLAKDIIEHSKINNYKCIIIDNSSVFRLCHDVPLIVPEINSNKLFESKSTIISNPNCTTTMLVMLLNVLRNIKKIVRIVISTYQASSGAGIKGLNELLLQTKQISDKDILTTDFWKKQYALNIFSHNSSINPETGFNEEEEKIINETHKILNDDTIKISPTCIRVPTLRSHCLSINVEFESEVNLDDIIELLKDAKGIKLFDFPEKNLFPEPVITEGKTDIFVGRIRHDIGDKRYWNFFISGDQLLKGAGYNSVQILELLLK